MQESKSQLIPATRQIRQKGGFTLVEVLVVIAIIGILGAMGVMSMRDKVAVEAVKGDVVTVRSFLDEMSARARAKDTSYSVNIVGMNLRYYLGSGCAGNVLGQIRVESRDSIKVTNTTSLPSEFTGSPLNWAAASSCIQFTPRSRIGLNPLATDGYIVIVSRQNPQIRGIVGKTPNTNKPLQFFSLNGGTLWVRL